MLKYSIRLKILMILLLGVGALAEPDVQTFSLKDDGSFPNNILPLLAYRQAIIPDDEDPASSFEKRFKENGWTRTWRNGIYDFQHYHSTAHEVLGCYSGSAELQVGGRKGPKVTVSTGDVIIVPAGVAHRRVSATEDFAVVGAYPRGTSPDLNYGDEAERPRTDNNINDLRLPPKDPVYGEQGPLHDFWEKENPESGF